MEKKSPLVLPPLPPLSLVALQALREIEDYAKDALADCCDLLQIDNPGKARRILRTCLVEALNVQMDYYRSLPYYKAIWTIEIIKTTIDSLVDQLPHYISRDQFRHELLGASAEYLEARRIRSAKPIVESIAQSEPLAHVGPSSTPPSPAKSVDSIGAQINRLREECRFSVEELAEEVELETRSVQRHIADVHIPHNRHLRAYERTFSKLLNRQVVISKTS